MRFSQAAAVNNNKSFDLFSAECFLTGRKLLQVRQAPPFCNLARPGLGWAGLELGWAGGCTNLNCAQPILSKHALLN
jgi:hypothetical protein|eukprot:COSAG06_NODE_38372_length_424_cov_1.190769_1_plen_77_part_00